MTTRKKVIKKEFIKIRVCDSCLTDIKPKSQSYTCYACKKDICVECLEETGLIKLCRDCAGSCKGCSAYPVEELVAAGLKDCPNCGYEVMK